MDLAELQQLRRLATDVKRQLKTSKDDLATAKVLATAVIALIEELRAERKKASRSDDTAQTTQFRRG
jgi:hypothetical protein